MAVTISAVPEAEHDAFFAMLREYMAEMDQYDPEIAGSHFDVDLYIEAMLADMEGREFLWILDDGMRVGLAIVRLLEDFPHEERMVASISEFYVAPAFRRLGVGSDAVAAILEDHRGRGTYEVEAGILAQNAPALAFWERLGFITRSIYTSRRP